MWQVGGVPCIMYGDMYFGNISLTLSKTKEIYISTKYLKCTGGFDGRAYSAYFNICGVCLVVLNAGVFLCILVNCI